MSGKKLFGGKGAISDVNLGDVATLGKVLIKIIGDLKKPKK